MGIYAGHSYVSQIWIRAECPSRGGDFPNIGQLILESLRSKHPEARPLTASSLDVYRGKPPALVPVDITDETVATVERQLLGAAGPGGADSVSLQHWLLRFGVASMGLKNIVREFGDRMANGLPPWAAYRSLMPERLTSLKNCPGVWPFIVGETWHQILKCACWR